VNASDGGEAGRLVVGFDGGWRMQTLLRVAAQEAVSRQLPLAIVMVSRAALDSALGATGRRSAERRAEASANRQLNRAAQSVQAHFQHLLVTTHHLTEEEARAARHPLSSAHLLVVGTVGQHGRRAFSPESVSRILLKATRCPVLVVPHDVAPESGDQRHRAVTVGVGENSSDAAVIQAAGSESLRRGCDLELFHAYGERAEETPGEGLRRAADVVARAIAAVDVPLGERGSVLLARDDPAGALTRHSRDSELLVIGSCLGSFAGRTPGSVGLRIVGSLHCPLLVIPDPVPDPWSRRPVERVGG
jgi:nucleotide-binding universal stress UspA family protein